jgi:hypothetical protein
MPLDVSPVPIISLPSIDLSRNSPATFIGIGSTIIDGNEIIGTGDTSSGIYGGAAKESPSRKSKVPAIPLLELERQKLRGGPPSNRSEKYSNRSPPQGGKGGDIVVRDVEDENLFVSSRSSTRPGSRDRSHRPSSQHHHNVHNGIKSGRPTPFASRPVSVASHRSASSTVDVDNMYNRNRDKLNDLNKLLEDSDPGSDQIDALLREFRTLRTTNRPPSSHTEGSVDQESRWIHEYRV